MAGSEDAGWDPDRYLEFGDERARPFADLLARVDARRPRTVVDLGCGPGQLTRTLPQRWPEAHVLGVDSSPEMIARASAYAGPRLEFRLGDLATWEPAAPVDVVVSNAALQWVPDHREVLPRLVAALAPGGWLAFQVPGNFEAPSHVLLRDLAGQEPYVSVTSGVRHPASAEPQDYLDDLASHGCRVDAWETTYVHVLSGPDPVFRWVSGTGARPVLQSLPEPLRGQFEQTYQQRLREAYPERPWGTALAFRRIFVVAQLATGSRLAG